VNNLAWLLATARDPSLRDPTLAVALAERAAALSPPPDPSVADTLAAAYAAAGRYGDAVRVAEQALRQVEAGGPPALAEPIRARIALYRAGQPYRE
jgi:spermidine synthase